MTSSNYKELKKLLDNIKNLPDDKLSYIKKEFEFILNKTDAVFQNKNHKTSKLKDIDIDINIKKLIKLIWKCDIDTNNSCENNVPKNYIWICFDSFSDFYNFMSIVTANIDPDLMDRILYSHESDLDSWIYNLNMNDSRLYFSAFDNDLSNDSNNNENDESDYINYHNKHPYILEPCFSVRFPKKDYNFVCNQFENYISSKKNEN